MPPRSSIHGSPAPSPLVLVVEDEASVREAVAEALRQAGFEVVAVDACEAAVEILRSRPDLRVLVTDVFTPGPLNGYELARIARERFPRVAVLVASAQARPGHGDVALGAWFVAKPFRLGVLVEVVREAARLHPERTERRAAG